MNKKVNLQGISRMFPSNLSNDGLCRDIVNARLYNGALRPIGAHNTFQSAGVVAGGPAYIHTVTNGDKYIIAYNSISPGNITYTLVGGSTVNTLTAIGAGKTIRFTALHNVLLIINETDETIAYSLFSTDTDTYSYIGTERFPDVLQVDFSATHYAGYDVEKTDIDVTGAWEGDNEAIMAALLTLTADNFNNSGRFTGSIGIVYAWELFDGSIIKHSIPFYLRSGKWWWKNNGPGDPTHYSVKSEFWICAFQIKTSDSDLNTIRSIYSKIIKSLNIYITNPLNTYNSGISSLETNYTEVHKDSESTVEKKVIQDPAYYLISKIGIDDLVENYEDELYGSDISAIPTLEPLPVDNFTHHKLYGNCDFLYNSRVWLGKTVTQLYKGFNPNLFVIKPTSNHDSTAYLVYFEVELKDGSDVKTVISDQYSCVYYDSGNKRDFALETFVGYPDSRASKITVKTIVGGFHYKAAEYNLTPHPFHNFAYYLFSDIGAINQDDWIDQVVATVSDKINDNNRVQASKVSNPFMFPADNSYRIGVGSVIGMGANTLLIETGQFGEFPVYVFTDSGVWALSISNDISILVDRIVPATGDVCSNGKSILPTDQGVVFFSNEGIILISGMKSVRLSLPLEGLYESILDSNANFGAITASKLIADVSDYLEDISLNTFLSGAVIGYNYKYKEIIISNAGKEYSYIYSFLSMSWYRSGVKYNRYVNHFPKFLAERSGVLYDITDELFTNYIPVFVESYPIKLEVDSYKKLIALASRGLFKSDPTKGLGLFVFGSINGVDWSLISMNEKEGEFLDIIARRSPYSVVFLSIIISGSLGENSYLSHLDVSFDIRFENRIR